MKTTYDIQRIKDSLPPLSQLFTRDGYAVKRSGSAMFSCCPFHEEKTPSCQVDDDAGRFHCFGCGAGGDSIDYLQKTWGTSFQDTLAQLASSHGILPDSYSHAPRKAATPKPEEPIGPMTGAQLDRWQQSCERLLHAEGEIQRIAEWRGIDPECVRWAAARGLMGLYIWWDIPREAFLVEMPSPSGLLPVSVHIRLAPRSKGHPRPEENKASWNFDPKKRGAWPFVIGDPATAEYIFLLEGQWDALALVSMMGWHRREKWPRIALFGLRGSSGGGKMLAHTLNPRARLFAIADADGAGAAWFEEGSLLDKLHAKVRDVIGFWPTSAKHDLNDLVKSGELTRDAFLHHITPLMPLRKGRGPTFLQWCKGNSKAADALGRAASYVLRDNARPKGRRPLRDWERHWRKCQVPEDLYADLCLAWRQHLAPSIAAIEPSLPLTAA
jgi:hypothetical protein